MLTCSCKRKIMTAIAETSFVWSLSGDSSLFRIQESQVTACVCVCACLFSVPWTQVAKSSPPSLGSDEKRSHADLFMIFFEYLDKGFWCEGIWMCELNDWFWRDENAGRAEKTFSMEVFLCLIFLEFISICIGLLFETSVSYLSQN